MTDKLERSGAQAGYVRPYIYLWDYVHAWQARPQNSYTFCTRLGIVLSFENGPQIYIKTDRIPHQLTPRGLVCILQYDL